MAIKVTDPIKRKKPKRYEEYDEVDELGADGMPTGRKIKVYRVAGHNLMVERENWLNSRLKELEADPEIGEVIVQRGKYDDVIGITIIRKVVT